MRQLTTIELTWKQVEEKMEEILLRILSVGFDCSTTKDDTDFWGVKLGGSRLNIEQIHPSKETKDKISKAKEGKNHSETAKLKMSDTRRYNFLRKALEATSAGNWTLADLVDFLNEKKTNKNTMSVFAQTIYGLAQAEVDELIKIPTDTVAQHTVYARLTARIKELYDERIQDLTQTEHISA